MWLSAKFKATYPEMHERYMKALGRNGIMHSPFAPWSTVSLNMDFACQPHLDKKDYSNGLCWVVTFGDEDEGFTGGELELIDLNVKVAMQDGHIVAFRSHCIEHQVLPYTGKRNSLVLFFCDNLYYSTKRVRQ